MYFADYFRLSSDDEVAALIAHDLAQGLHSYTGVLNGQFMFTKNGYFPFNYIAKRNELSFDKQAVDFLVKAGYNPKALETALNKTTGEWRGTFWGRHNKTDKRINAVYEYIKTKYPKYLNSNSFTNSIHYKNAIK
jgi:predicted Zn-dependent protease